MQVVLMQVLKLVGSLVLNMLLGLILSPKYIYGLIIKGLRWLVGSTETKKDDELLDRAEEEWAKEGIPEKKPFVDLEKK